MWSRQSRGYPYSIIRSFDELLEHLGTRGTRFEKWSNQLSEELKSDYHNQYQQGIVKLGSLFGYDSKKPKHGAATDCRWRGIFGNQKELFTFELKIEHVPAGKIIPTDIGQAHNQISRAKAEYESMGYSIRSSIITHLSELMPSAESSAGEIKIITKESILEMWEHVRILLIDYRSDWSLDDINKRRIAAEKIRPRLPESGWLIRAINFDERFITIDELLKEWKK